tara:strand:- start:538 stop:786 length:249 start_codon:yes stop_codon:yes gene_type:complete
MSYAKLKFLCDTVSLALTDNTKFIPENSRIYDKNTVRIQSLTNSNFTGGYKHNIPEDLKNFEPVINTKYKQYYIGNCKSCNN